MIKNIIEGGLQFISDLIKAFAETGKALVTSFLQALKDTVTDRINFIKENIVGKFGEIKVVFSNFQKNVMQLWVNMWNGLKEKVHSILGGIKDYIKGVADWMVQKIKSIGDSFGSFGSKVSGWFGGNGRTSNAGVMSRMSVPSPYAADPAYASLASMDIPAYATGQVIPRSMKQHLDIMGDNNQETEVVSPLSTIKKANKESLLEVLSELGVSGGSAAGGNTYQFSVDGRVFFEIIQKYAEEYKKQTGGRPAFG